MADADTLTRGPSGAGDRQSSLSRLLNKDSTSKWLLISPLLLFLAAFMLYPTLYSLYMSFTDYIMRGAPNFVGLDNYRYLLDDPVFWEALGRTLFVLVACIVIELCLGLAIALLLNRDFWGQDLIKGLCFVPLLISPLAMSLMWNYMLHIQFGVVNDMLQAIGLPAVGWFSTTGLAIWSIVFISVWQWLPFSIFVLLAGLRSLPRDQFEAAQVDGLSAWRVFFLLQLPMLAPLIIIIVLLRTMWLMRLFDPLYGTTRGGLNTELLDWMIYRTAFVDFDIGLGTAYAMFALYLTLIGCLLMYKRLMRMMKG
ncbi:MAG: sugar ABC transporter permease [Rhodobacter sp.]|nr:sugar ABC transporter permease [Rhodobacter sp.]MCY4166902.1 sugar ABC transporter permease [Rhodobacter sp.]MCY4241183.1 sugar ABC transporter permease [Rhodobacter sp.]